MEDYYRSNEPISLKLGVLIGLYQLEELINFGGDPLPAPRIWDFRRFISISHTVTGRLSRHSVK